MVAQILKRNVMLDGKILDGATQAVAGFWLKMTLVDTQHLVETRRNMKSQPSDFYFFTLLLGLHILNGEPTLVGESIFQLVAVAILFFGCQYRLRSWKIEVSEMLEIINDLLLFLV